jgi:Glycosyl transferase family 2/Tetratricopeptide repeat
MSHFDDSAPVASEQNRTLMTGEITPRDLRLGLAKLEDLRSAGDHSAARALTRGLQAGLDPSTRAAAGPDLVMRLEMADGLNEAAGGDHDRAAELLTPIFERHPESFRLCRVLAQSQVAAGQHEDALRTLSRGIGAMKDVKLGSYLAREALALRTYLAGLRRAGFAKPVVSEPEANAMIVMIARDEDDVILSSLIHHYRLGFRSFFICNNLSRDGTTELIEYFRISHPDALVMQMRDEVGGFSQQAKTQATVEFGWRYMEAAGRPADWCFVLDADEFIDGPPGQGLRDLLARADGKDCIGLYHCNLAAADGTSFDHHTSTVYDHFDLMVAEPTSPIILKMAFRTGAKPVVTLGNHRVIIPALTGDRVLAAAEAGFRLVHLPTRSVRQIVKKFARAAAVIEAEGVIAGRVWTSKSRDVAEGGRDAAEKILADYVRMIRRTHKWSNVTFKLKLPDPTRKPANADDGEQVVA